MKSRSSRALLPLLILLVGCGGGKKEEAPQAEAPLPRVKAVTLEPVPFVKRVSLIGVCRARHAVKVSTEEPGRVDSLHFDKGERVKGGSLLLKLDDTLLRATLSELQAAFEIAEINHKKLALLKEGTGAVSEFNLKNAALNKDMAAARLDSARARLDRMELRSPVSGIVEQRLVEKGEFLPAGAPVAEILDVSEIRVETGIAERDLAHFRVGTEAVVEFDPYPGKVYKGKLGFVGAGVNPATGEVTAEIRLMNGNGLLKPGMLARVTLVKEACGTCILLPQDALVDGGAGKGVFIVDQEGKARFREITLGETDDARVVVASGLEGGERVITVGQRGLVDGQKVEIVQ